MEPKIIINDGNVKLEFLRQAMTEAVQTHDGVCFNFIGGSYYYIQDAHMPVETRQKIAFAATSLSKGTLTIDAKNYQTPTLIEL